MGISLTEALAELRRELYAAQMEGAHQQFRFEIEHAELSLEVEFRQDGNGGVKVEVGALGATAGVEAGGALGSTRRQVLTLTLQVRDEALGGDRAKIRGNTGRAETVGDDATERNSDRSGTGGQQDVSEGHEQMRPWES